VLLHCIFENVFEAPMMATYFWLLVGVVIFLGYAAKNDLLKD
jgi:hypothetical protein